ncbi:MAG: PEP-CTERM sorting domain-containing protein [Kiritimatiellia bacterium]
MHAKLLILTTILGLVNASVRADLTYSFLDKGSIFDGKSFETVLLTDLDNGLTTNMTVTGIGDDLNSNAGGFGIGDDQIDGTSEIIELVFDQDIDFLLIDFGGVGSDINDGASLTLGSNSPLNLFTGVSGFNGTSDVYTPPSPVRINSGEKIVITGSSATSSFDLENISITVIPEPSSIMLVGLTALAAFGIIRRRKK